MKWWLANLSSVESKPCQECTLDLNFWVAKIVSINFRIYIDADSSIVMSSILRVVHVPNAQEDGYALINSHAWIPSSYPGLRHYVGSMHTCTDHVA